MFYRTKHCSGTRSTKEIRRELVRAQTSAKAAHPLTYHHHINLLRKARRNQIDIEQLSKTTMLTRTALTVALNNQAYSLLHTKNS